jgi:DNA helicase II / ATP-dependent DNA helicase PcrA
MKLIVDLHIHSKYSRACSKDMEPVGMEHWCSLKGIDVVATGDYVHPEYLKELKEKLEPAEAGLFKLKSKPLSQIRFILSVELALIYKHDGKVRKIHHLVLAPDFEAAEKLSKELGGIGNINSDGRPILGLDSQQLLQIIMGVSDRCMLIPAHAWTPWFSVFGSKSGYDSIEECFGKYADLIKAVETGLSSDRLMNQRCSMLDEIALVSNSDAHSPAKLGREANVLDCELSYDGITETIKRNHPGSFLHTIEFFPEEGKYHLDGHRDCGVRLLPRESQEKKNKCPVCHKPLTLGVLHRVEELADKAWNFKPGPEFVPQRAIIPLEELIADAFECGTATKKVRNEYLSMVQKGKSEFFVLLDLEPEKLKKISHSRVFEAIIKMRRGQINISPGFDGQFGKISIFRKKQENFVNASNIQMKLM